MNVDPARLAAQPQNLLDDAGVVLDGSGIGHGEHGGVPAHGGGPGTGEDGFSTFTAGLAQMGVDVDQAGQSHQAIRVIAVDVVRSPGGGVGADGGDNAVNQQNVGGGLAVGASSGQQVRDHN